MATFKFSGHMRYHDDSKLWTEIVKKERGVSKENVGQNLMMTGVGKTFAAPRAVSSVRPKSGVVGDRRQQSLQQTKTSQSQRNLFGNVQIAKKDGLLQSHYLNDNPNHFSDPPYHVIKPGYRAHVPLKNFNQLDMKSRYSFKPFGDPKISRPNQDMQKTFFRGTMQSDTAYFKDDRGPVDVKHALVDMSHTLYEKPLQCKLRADAETRARKNYLKYDFKVPGREKKAENLQHERRVTYDFNGVPIVRLAEKRDLIGEEKEDPVESYYKAKQDNDSYFKAMSRADSLSEKFNVTQSHFPMRKNTTKPFEKAGCMQTVDGASSNVHKSVFTVNNEIAQQLGKQTMKSRPGTAYAKDFTSTQRSRPKSAAGYQISKQFKKDKLKVVTQMLKNEKKVNSLLRSEVEQLSRRISSGRSELNLLMVGK